jgi:hypothetical protein
MKTMEGRETYKQAYDYLDKLCRNSTSDQFTINYNNLDGESEKQLRDLICNFIKRRKAEIYNGILVKCD